MPSPRRRSPWRRDTSRTPLGLPSSTTRRTSPICVCTPARACDRPHSASCCSGQEPNKSCLRIERWWTQTRSSSEPSLQHGTLQFGWRMPSEASFRNIGPEIDATYMSDESTRGFTGTMIGMACVDAYRRHVIADFEYFDLQNGSHLD